MKKEELRKVRINNRPDGSGGFTIEALFHQWGDFPIPQDNGTDVPRTLGIVEIVSTGEISSVQPKCIIFTD